MNIELAMLVVSGLGLGLMAFAFHMMQKSLLQQRERIRDLEEAAQEVLDVTVPTTGLNERGRIGNTNFVSGYALRKLRGVVDGVA